ncbi:MAG: glycosyltransferase [Lachnospiraceae bacterium]|nr:glycosyltransferase [Lachnospiraceae bacterium]
MKIVIHRYNSICEPGYIEAFKALGMEVIEDDQEMRDKSIPADVRIGTIAEMILTHKPMFVFSINFFPYISDICERLHVMYVCVSVDCPVAELLSPAIRNSVNRVFLFDRRQYLEVADENPGHIYHLPLGVNPLIHAPGASTTSSSGNARHTGGTLTAPSDYRYDVSFVGSLYSEKNPYAGIRGKLSSRVQGMCDGLLAAQELLPGQDLMEAVLDVGGAGFASSDGSGERTSKDPDAAYRLVDELRNELEEHLPESLKGFEDPVRDIAMFWGINSCLGGELTVRDRLMLLSSIAESIRDIGSMHLFTRSDTALIRQISPHIVCHGGVNTLNEMPSVFATSRININTTTRSIRTGLPQRIWDVLGCGGFLLTNAQEEIPEYLESGRHLDVYETPTDACEKVRYYLTHEDERQQIAANGYAEVMARHTIMDRVTSMISMIMRDIDTRTNGSDI